VTRASGRGLEAAAWRGYLWEARSRVSSESHAPLQHDGIRGEG